MHHYSGGADQEDQKDRCWEGQKRYAHFLGTWLSHQIFLVIFVNQDESKKLSADILSEFWLLINTTKTWLD